MVDAVVVTLETLAGGAAAELWDAELRKVLENIRDENTDPDEKRELTLKVTIAPTPDREGLNTSVKVTSKLAGFRPIPVHLHMGRKDGQLVAVGFDPKQMDAFRTDNSVLPLNKNESAR